MVILSVSLIMLIGPLNLISVNPKLHIVGLLFIFVYILHVNIKLNLEFFFFHFYPQSFLNKYNNCTNNGSHFIKV